MSQRSISGHVRPLDVKMNAHEVRGQDFVSKVKMLSKVTHAPELTYDLTARRHTQIYVKPDLVFIDLA